MTMKTIRVRQYSWPSLPGTLLRSTTCSISRIGRARLGYKGVQIPSWDGRLFDLRLAAESKAYCDEVFRPWPPTVCS